MPRTRKRRIGLPLLLSITAGFAVCMSMLRLTGFESDRVWLLFSLFACMGAPIGGFIVGALANYFGFRRVDQVFAGAGFVGIVCCGFALAFIAFGTPPEDFGIATIIILAAWLPQVLGLAVTYFIGRS